MHAPSAQEVEVDMKNFLSGISCRVENDSVAIFGYPFLLSNLTGLQEKMAENGRFVIRDFIE